MDVAATIKSKAEQLKSCFYPDRKLAGRITIFIITGFTVLWTFMVECLFAWLIRMFQIVGVEAKLFIKDEAIPSGVRCIFMLICSPIIYLIYIVLPFFYMIFWMIDFAYNCLAYITSLGESGWEEISFEKSRSAHEPPQHASSKDKEWCSNKTQFTPKNP